MESKLILKSFRSLRKARPAELFRGVLTEALGAGQLARSRKNKGCHICHTVSRALIWGVFEESEHGRTQNPFRFGAMPHPGGSRPDYRRCQRLRSRQTAAFRSTQRHVIFDPGLPLARNGPVSPFLAARTLTKSIARLDRSSTLAVPRPRTRSRPAPNGRQPGAVHHPADALARLAPPAGTTATTRPVPDASPLVKAEPGFSQRRHC